MNSADLFKDNKITMVNVWGSWYHNCVGEMKELTEIHKRLQAKGCGIVGIECEQKPIDTIRDEVRAFLREKGVNYPNVIMPSDNEIFNGISGYPTTFFVDSEGTILTLPISGAMVDAYEPAVDQLLAGEALIRPATPGPSRMTAASTTSSSTTWTAIPSRARSSSSATRPPAPSSPPTPRAWRRSAWRRRRSTTSMC